MRAQQAEREFAIALPGAIFHMQTSQVFGRREKLRIGARTGAEVNGPAGKVAAKLRNIRIVAVEEGHAVGRQRGHQLELGARDAGLTLGKVLDVRRANIGHNAPIGRGNARQRRDLTRMVHADFKNAKGGIAREARQGQGHVSCPFQRQQTRAPAPGAIAAVGGRRRCSDCQWI